MPKTIALYLAGTIKKGHEDSHDCWTEDHMDEIRAILCDYDVAFLNPALRADDLSDQMSVFGRDMLQVACADVVLVDARRRRGLGVGAEMMWAKSHGIPVVTWAPKDSHYNQSRTSLLGVEVTDWIHPFVFSLSDGIVENLDQAAKWVIAYAKGNIEKIKSFQDIREAMAHYTKTQFSQDLPMKNIVDRDSRLTKRHESLIVLKQ